VGEDVGDAVAGDVPREGDAASASELLRIAHDVTAAPSEERLAQALAEGLLRLSGAALVAAYLLGDEQAPVLAGVAAAGDAAAGPALPVLAARALAARTTVDATAEELAGLTAARAAEGVAVPVGDDEPLGVVVLVAGPSSGISADRELVALLVGIAAATLANARRVRAAIAEARRDELTGLGNQRAFYERLAALVGAEPGSGREAALVLFDLDDFKQINDVEGHAAGDEVLRSVALVALRAVRVGDVVYRVGGEEFALLVEGDARAGVQVAERVRRALAQERRGHRLPTMSAGVAAFPQDAVSEDQLVRCADLALYEAKRAGKNRTVLYSRDTHLPGQPPDAARPR
jgi:diguanylate cyclase (GGDEF)-like protein